MANIFLILLRLIFTVADVVYVFLFIQYLSGKRGSTLAQVLLGDVDQTSSFYQAHSAQLNQQIRRIYIANIIFITLFTIYLWVTQFNLQMWLGLISLIAFIGLIIVEFNYRKLLKGIGDNQK